MADEVPACDVLCEAMEYLAKLGSNLRSRSESLKEKKIRKDRLKNSHAVQKAAQKVLTICELSKRSLENVETGVKKVLSIVDAAQQSEGDGAKKPIDNDRYKKTSDKPKPTTSRSDVNPSYKSNENHLSSPRRITMSGKSYVLRIPRKVSVQHYMSVKVLAKQLPKSMAKKYPVYYNCKLYRDRQRSYLKKSRDSSHESGEIENTSIDIKNKLKIKDLSKNDDDFCSTNSMGPTNNDLKESVSEIEKETTEKEGKKSDKEDSQRKESGTDEFSTEKETVDSDTDSINRRVSENDKIKCSVEKEITDFDKHSKQRRMSETDKYSMTKEKMKPDKHFKKRRESESDKYLTDKEKMEPDKLSKERRESETDVLKGKRFSSLDKENHRKKNIEQSESSPTKSDKTGNECAKPKKKKYKKLKVLDTSSSENEEAQKKEDIDVICIDDEVEVKTTDENLRTENKENLKQTSDTEPIATLAENNPKEIESSQKNVDEPAKPLIKCVSLTKLLKPDILETEHKSNSPPSSVPLNQTSKINSKLIVHMTTKGELKERYYQESISKTAMTLKDYSSAKKIKKVRYQDEEEFWEQKRKEVKAFKPKKFDIKVMRLAKLSQSFLNHYNLTKITQSGTVLCELSSVTNGDKENANNCDISVEKSTTNEAKNALLDDSDDDIPPVILSDTLASNTESVNNSLVNDSALDKNENNEKSFVKNGNNEAAQKRNEKYKLLDSSKSQKNKDKKKSQPSAVKSQADDKTHDIKSSLLEDSESDKNEDQVKQTQISDQNKKAADKTEKVKSSLLEDSESDKNEDQDEQPKISDQNEKAADETEKVKSSLLEDSESDQNEDQNKKPEKSDQNKKAADETENVKSSLLEDSESDKNENQGKQPEISNQNKKAADETENVKSSLLQDSESDKNDDQNQTLSSELGTNKKNARKALLCDVDSYEDNSHGKDTSAAKQPECSEREEQARNDAEETAPNVQSEINSEKQQNYNTTSVDVQDKELAKSSLLNDSSDGGTKPEHKKGRKSRRKHIMESMHAKKMLLTYSSSSDTEDEQLKNVIKDMKDDLLKNIEDEAKNSLKKRMLSSSESDEDIVKKKRRVGDEISPIIIQEPESNKDEETDKEKHKIASAESSDSSLKKSKSRTAKMGRSREKPGGSSSQNSDQEDKDIEGLTNLETLNKTRRGGDSGSKKSASTRSSSRKMAKAPKVFTENLLSPESSDDASAAESDGPEEDLPQVSVAGFNGDGIDHLAKDDLLEESESDNSKNNSSDAVKKEDDSDSSTVKAKRRKGQTISSDSEAGSSRRKNANAKISDFEDSEEESSEPVKNAKRKKTAKKGSDSDASGGSSEGGKKKRKRIKQIDSDDDGSGSDSENEGRNKHGRKNIRKVMGKNQLEEATKKAAREEKERVARIAERQKMYNNLEFDESGKPDEVIVDKVILDFDPETKEPLIEVDRGLVKKLKPHQANGIKFMWDACFESAKRIKKDRGSGCILAHCMGLGKTLQVVSLTHTLLTHSDLTNVNRVLVVCPLSTVLNWVNEFRMWLKHAHNEPDVDVYELSRFKQNCERAFQLSQWLKHGGVCVLGYEMFRNLSADNPKKFKKKMLKQFQESLVDPGPDLVVCDEGHLLKNEKTSLSQSMNRVKTRRRIVLTGTPLQNNLKEYYCMVQFVKPNLLGKYNEYLNRFVNPITNGQYTDSTEHDIRIMKRRSHVLHKMLDGAVQRRDYGVLAPFLPPKHEYVLFITLAEVQIKLYQHYLDNYSRRPLPGKSSGFLFPDFQSLQRIWTHPLVLKYNSERYEIMQQKKREREEEEDSEGSLVDFIDDDSTPDETSTEESFDDSSDMSDDSRKKSKKKKASKKNKKEKESKKESAASKRNTRANPVELVEEIGDPSIIAGEVKNDNPTEWWIPLVTDDELDDMRNSHKLVLLFEILRQCEAIGDKLLVFSQSLYSLDLIEHFLGKVDEATQEGRIDEKLGNHVGSWSPGIDYFRLDGSTSCENRSIWCKNFNREDNPRARLFLISTRAGGLGINLVAANRVVIFDVSWNPSHDVQSIFRVYRFGQKKPCYIYRFLAMGTMEEKIYERQVTKQAISKRVIDEQQIDRHYAENDLAELYKFEPTPPVPRPVPLVPKDRLFAEMLKEHESKIYKFHEHDSLLENKEEETLSEEERKAAWDDFENEKNRPPPQPFPSWPMHNGMPNMNLMAAQQQQLAYAALAGMLRKDMPTLTDDTIRQMLPLLYSSNPAMFGGYDYGLMQKLSEMYKYAQPGMMNPQMMNMNNMNAGSGGGGGSSGLQYEPPWQRQQQQQQQLRLQQLMQQQNQMGAKFYAGGLGSRDPVAMALQQQRAREIMLGGGGTGAVTGAGRPRGRPPLTPRAPPTATNDVVNLDSD